MIPKKNEIGKYREEYELNENDIALLLPGRLTYGKGHIYLVEAVAKIQCKYDKHIVLLFAGGMKSDGEKLYMDKILQGARENNVDARYIGFQKMPKILAASDIMVLPSLYEGFPIVCIESFFMKTPVIRSDAPGSTDMKDICMVFHKKDTDRLSEYISYAIENPDKMKEMAELAYDKAMREYTVKAMTKKTVKYYENIIKKK